MNGQQFFCLKDNTVQKLIQDLPGSENCNNYVKKVFYEVKKKKNTHKVIDIDPSKFVTFYI